jgi:hypothetical protein
MRVFKYKKFAKFAKKQRIADAKLCEVVKEMEDGIIHTDLGGGVFKQRVAREGQGKSGNYRTIVFYKVGELVFFVHGFLKADEENITQKQEEEFKELAKIYLNLSDSALGQLVETQEFTEVRFNAEN